MPGNVPINHLRKDCIKHGGYINPNNGYGYIRHTDRNVLAHREKYQEAHGKIPDGMFVLHKCDNRACVNPDHLELGSQRENLRQMVDRGRQGATVYKPVISDKTRQKIIAANGLQKHIAERFGIHPSTVSRIKNGKDSNRLRG